MKVPTKDELYAHIAALTKENHRLQAELDAKDMELWQKDKDKAFKAFYIAVPYLPREMCFVTLDHIDRTGYWFTFELQNDSRIQTYCVRHTDL